MRYANITSIPSSYIVAFFSSLGDASPPGEDALPAGKGTLSAGEDALHAHPYIYHYIYYLEFLIDFSALHAPFKEIDMVNCTLE